MTSPVHDVVIIGGGILGMATAMALACEASARPRSVVIVEAADRPAAHQTGHNSGVIHSGLYYPPGSRKALNCVAGRAALLRFCAEYAIAHEICGKIVVATHVRELPALAELERRGLANGLLGLRRLRMEEIREHEPHAQGIAGLLVPQTGIVDYVAVTHAFARQVEAGSGELRLAERVVAATPHAAGIEVQTTRTSLRCRVLVNCGGLHADRVATLCGVDPELRIVPFRGEYYELTAARRHLVKNLIYPVPDPRLPFLGVHFTRRITGGIEAGPNAVLALKREGYHRLDVSPRDALEIATYSGTWRLARRYWRTGLAELHRSFRKRAFVAALRALIPELTPNDVHPAGSGVRAQALRRDGRLVDDFHIIERPRMIHVLNAPSPAATAAISIGEAIAARVRERL